ncbi:PREDICTED: uncharacterized protein LOC105556581 [Vollenhovia emeryi]|uniref:uncharacterized protein LOC105556581 n=1 Tax=Vollenhovia emeryi TaxID=411798 RepID=UPI0005F3FFD1|nr:PREDICTED: uncharacterized protein LOC105556581 [Vollenhovia emeryi]
MKTSISWPPTSMQSISLKKEVDASSSWSTYNVIVLRFYKTLLAARNGRNGFIMSSTYETDIKLGRGKRKKTEGQHFDINSSTNKKKRFQTIENSDDSNFDSDDPMTAQFASKKNVAAPPLVPYKPENNKTESQKIRSVAKL